VLPANDAIEDLAAQILRRVQDLLGSRT
jgi:hypothetical protein